MSRWTPTGIAWVSGDGGTRGYWTDGPPLRPAEGRDARGHAARTRSRTPAAACPTRLPATTTGGFEHNAWRPVGALGAARRPALPARRAAAGDRGGLRPGRRGVPQSRAVHDRVARGQLRRAGVALDARRPRSASGRRHLEPVRAGGLTAGRRPVPPVRQLLLRPLLRRGRQHGDVRVVRRGHPVPGHLRSGEPDPVRVLAARRRRRLGLLHAPAATSTRRTGPRRRRAAADERRERGPQLGREVAVAAPSARQRRFLTRVATRFKPDPGTSFLCLIERG